MEQSDVRLVLRLAGDGVQAELLPEPGQASGSGSAAGAEVTPPPAEHAPLAPGTPSRGGGSVAAGTAQLDGPQPPPPSPKLHGRWAAVEEAVEAAREHDALAFLFWLVSAAAGLARRGGRAVAAGGRRAAASAAAAARRAATVPLPLRTAWGWAAEPVPLKPPARAALAALLLACLLVPLAAYGAGYSKGRRSRAELLDAGSAVLARGEGPAPPAFRTAQLQAQQAAAGQPPRPAALPAQAAVLQAGAGGGNADVPPWPCDSPPDLAPLDAWLEAEAGGAPPATVALRDTAARAWAAASSGVRDYWHAPAWVHALIVGAFIPGCFLAGSAAMPALRAAAGRRRPVYA